MEKEKDITPSDLRPTDHLANERTFLAWIRTSIAIMAFGFVVVKFALFVKQITIIVGESQGGIALPGKGYSGLLGISLVGLGAAIALLSYFRYKHIEKQLVNQSYYPSLTLSLMLTIAIIAVGVLLVLYLIPSL